MSMTVFILLLECGRCSLFVNVASMTRALGMSGRGSEAPDSLEASLPELRFVLVVFGRQSDSWLAYVFSFQWRLFVPFFFTRTLITHSHKADSDI